jgi:DNA modification methylase
MKKINIYIYCSKKQIPILLEYAINKKLNYDILTFNKTNPTPLCNNKYLSDTEYIIFLRERGVKIFGNYHTKFTYYIDKVNTEDKKKYKHPTIKPLELIKRHIINSSNEGDTILDCFMGSGTTGVACMNTNRKFIGIELDENYFNIAKDRIENSIKNK